MKNAFPLDEEKQRLQQLYFYQLQDLRKESVFDSFAKTAAVIAESPIAHVSLMDESFQSVISCVGIELDQVDREDTLCKYVVEKKERVLIEDTLLDERSKDSEILKEAGIRFYLGIPLKDPKGFVLGTLCVLDFKPRALSSEQLSTLSSLGEATTEMLLTRRSLSHAHYFGELFRLTNNLIGVLNQDFEISDPNLLARFPRTITDPIGVALL